MRHICPKDGSVANSKFDASLLKPIKKNSGGWDESKLTPISATEPQKSEGFLAKLPRNILTNLANVGHSALNFPSDVGRRVEDLGGHLNLLRQAIGTKMPFGKEIEPASKERLSDIIPRQEEHDFAQMLGQKGSGTLMDNLIQNHLTDAIGAGGLVKAGLRALPITQRGASRQLRMAEKLIKERGHSVPISQQLLDESLDFLPKTHATREMMAGAAKGEYGPAFGIQSQVGHHARNLKKSPLASERLLAPVAGELKQNMLSQIESKLRLTGDNQAADLLRGGIKDFRNYMKFREKALPVLRAIGIPTTVLGGLAATTYGYKNIKKLLGD